MVWYGGDSQKYKIKSLYDNKTDDDDTSETLSLGSFYILDLFTDDLVFEYTGRPMFPSHDIGVMQKSMFIL